MQGIGGASASERAIEKAIYERINLEAGCICWKVPDQRQTVNGEYRKDPMQWAGQPDLIAVIHGEIKFIEIKTAKGRLSKAQKIFHKKLLELGVTVEVMRSLDDLLLYLGGAKQR